MKIPKMEDFSLLIGGKAGFGIDKAGAIIGRLLNQLGYRIYIYRDYPSLIRGGHTFSIIRAAKERIGTHKNKIDTSTSSFDKLRTNPERVKRGEGALSVNGESFDVAQDASKDAEPVEARSRTIDFILALNQETLDLHRPKLKKDCLFVYDAEQVKSAESTCGIGLALAKILKEENAPEIMRNTCIIGAFARAAGIKWEALDAVLRKEITKEIELNLKVCRRGYDAARELVKIEPLAQKPLPLLTGNQAIGLGLIKAGLKTYIAYPMTPSSPILHFLAEVAGDFGLKVIHPESEIGVMLMALGFSYMGERVAVGTSGGGFCLMTEGLSFAAMAELPVVIILGQRPGPSTGLPTYSAQTELHFALNAGQGEFARFIVAPADPEEAYYWSGVAMNLSWKYQLPSIILSDKNLGEGTFNFDIDAIKEIREETPFLWDRKSSYKRYLNTENGASPLAFVPEKGAIIKVNSYEHDEFGITTEDPKTTTLMQDKRLRKEKYLLQELENYETVKAYGKKDSSQALLCWGSNKGVCVEAAVNLGLKVIQPLVLNPFPIKQFQKALNGVKRLISVENNATGQLARLIKNFGFNVDEQILKYDGRPFALDELQESIGSLLK